MRKDKTKAQAKTPSINVSALRLWRLEFVREDGKVEIPDETTLEFTLGVSRISRDTLVIDLSVAVKNISTVKAEATYRAHFQVDMDSDAPDDLEKTLKTVAGRTAPAILFPYLREAISSAAMKAGLNKIILPIVNFQNQFSVDDIELSEIEQSGQSE